MRFGSWGRSVSETRLGVDVRLLDALWVLKTLQDIVLHVKINFAKVNQGSGACSRHDGKSPGFAPEWSSLAVKDTNSLNGKNANGY